MSFPVFFDTCALFGGLVNDLILRLAEEQALLSYTRYPQMPEDYAYILQHSGVPKLARHIYPTLDALNGN